jgi:formylglycine-generating enzyme required for sulfatase activity
MHHARFLIFIVLAMFAAHIWWMSAASADAPDTREFQECTDCPVMLGVPAGRFAMGSPANEQGRFESEGPQHYVNVRAFALGKYDVTSEQFLIFLRETGYQPKPCNKILNMVWRSPGNGYAFPPEEIEPRHWPAVCLDWHDADAYIAWLNKRAAAAHPELARKSGPYRLPSEAEWEYAARAGTTTARWWGNDIGVGHANCNGCGSQWDNNLLTDVDAFSPNAFGLYGMLGNVWQWTADCWHKSYIGAPAKGAPWLGADCARHVIRGGGWDNTPIFIRSAARSGAVADGGEFDYSSYTGFRVARDLP